jgi:hypothetical protein
VMAEGRGRILTVARFRFRPFQIVIVVAEDYDGA